MGKQTVTNIRVAAYKTLKNILIEENFGTSVLNPGAGFIRIFTVTFDKLF